MRVRRGVAIILEHVQVSTQRDQITLELRCDLLPLAPRAEAVPSTVMAMPVLVADNVVQALVEVRLQAKCTVLTLALVLDHRLFLGSLRLTGAGKAIKTLVKLLVEIRVNGLELSGVLRLVVGVQRVRINVQVLQPGEQLVTRQGHHV